MTSRPPGSGIRDVARAATRMRIAAVALDLFAERSFESVTVEQVAERVGISPRSAHRYFSSKEDMVMGPFEEYGETVLMLLRARPAEEAPLVAMSAALDELLARGSDQERDRIAMRLLASTPSIRARVTEKHLAWSALLSPVIAERMTGDDASLRARVVVESALVAFQLALLDWADDPRGRDMRQLLAAAFTAFEPAR